MELLNKVRSTIKKYSMLKENETVLIGLSGGPDSTCLTLLLKRLIPEFGLKLHTVYIDHGLRPLEIEREISFSKNLSDSLDIPFTFRTVDVRGYAKEHGMSKQESARILRYEIFNKIAHEINAQKIAVGHNLNDQIETFFMRIIQGGGRKGMSSIPPISGNIIRPLIETERKDIEGFLNKNKISYMVDSSNLKTDYMRNKIRFSIMPLLTELNPNIVNTISRTIEIFRQEDRYLESLTTKEFMRLISKKTETAIELFLIPLEFMDKVILRRLLRRAIDETKGLRGIGFLHIEDIISLIKEGGNGARIYLPNGIRVIKQYSRLLITSKPPQRLSTYTLKPNEDVALKEAEMLVRAEVVERFEGQADGRSIAIFDADKLTFPLNIRPRQNGDFFYPFGFKGRKKIQDFFVDEKVVRDERDSVPIITSGDDIIWIVGYRSDNRFRVTSGTKRVLLLTVKYLR